MLDNQFVEDDQQLRRIQEDAQVIAIVGEANDHYYTSYQVTQYLKTMGYKVYPVNPTIADVDGERNYASLAGVPEPIDIVDVFRNPTVLDQVVDEAIAAGAKTLWTQLEVVSIDEQPERRALAAGLHVISNHRIRTEPERLKVPARPK